MTTSTSLDCMSSSGAFSVRGATMARKKPLFLFCALAAASGIVLVLHVNRVLNLSRIATSRPKQPTPVNPPNFSPEGVPPTGHTLDVTKAVVSVPNVPTSRPKQLTPVNPEGVPPTGHTLDVTKAVVSVPKVPTILADIAPPTAPRDADVNRSQGAPSKKKVVYACERDCGGWADRQKGIVSAYVLAELLDRHFGIYMSFPCDLGLFATPNKVNWKVKAEELQGEGLSMHSAMDLKAFTFTHRLLMAPDLHDELPADVTVLMWNMELVEYLRHHKLASHVQWLKGKRMPEVYRKVLGDLFTLSPEIQKTLSEFQRSVPRETKLVCAQVRLGNHTGFDDSETYHNLGQFAVLAHFLSQYNDLKKYRIFVASDADKIVDLAKREFPDVFLSIPGPITHTDKNTGPEACEGFKKAITDEYALSMCDILVISESGLGKIASFLRGSDKDLYLFYDDKIVPFKRTWRFPNRPDW